MKKDNKIYFWVCDYCNISGEGILAKLFIKEYLKKKPNSIFVNIAKNNKFQKRDNFIKNRNKFNGIFHKYFHRLGKPGFSGAEARKLARTATTARREGPGEGRRLPFLRPSK